MRHHRSTRPQITLRARILRYRQRRDGRAQPRPPMPKDCPYVVAPRELPPGSPRRRGYRVLARYATEAEARAACPPGYDVRLALVPTRWAIYYPSDADFPVIPDELTT